MPYMTSRIEEILNGTFTGTPQSRIEALLLVLVASGGGGTGTTNYNYLSNLPKIGGVLLQGDKSLSDLGIINAIRNEINSIDVSAKVQTAVENYLLAHPVSGVDEARCKEIIESYGYMTESDLDSREFTTAEAEAWFN